MKQSYLVVFASLLFFAGCTTPKLLVVDPMPDVVLSAMMESRDSDMYLKNSGPVAIDGVAVRGDSVFYSPAKLEEWYGVRAGELAYIQVRRKRNAGTVLGNMFGGLIIGAGAGLVGTHIALNGIPDDCGDGCLGPGLASLLITPIGAGLGFIVGSLSNTSPLWNTFYLVKNSSTGDWGFITEPDRP